MPTLQIRNLPQELYDRLKQAAEEAKRSMTQQAIVILEKKLMSEEEERKKQVERLQAINQQTKGVPDTSIEEITKIIREMRDR